MADIIDLQSRKKYPEHAESEASLADPTLDPVTMPDADDLRMARALLIAQAERENERWARETNEKNRRAKVRRGRWSFFILGSLFGVLGWYWAAAVAVIMLVFMNRLVKE